MKTKVAAAAAVTAAALAVSSLAWSPAAQAAPLGDADFIKANGNVTIAKYAGGPSSCSPVTLSHAGSTLTLSSDAVGWSRANVLDSPDGSIWSSYPRSY